LSIAVGKANWRPAHGASRNWHDTAQFPESEDKLPREASSAAGEDDS